MGESVYIVCNEIDDLVHIATGNFFIRKISCHKKGKNQFIKIINRMFCENYSFQGYALIRLYISALASSTV